MTESTDQPMGGEPLSDDDMNTTETGSAPQQDLGGGGGDADGTDGTDGDGSDGGDADGTDGGDADGTDGSSF